MESDYSQLLIDIQRKSNINISKVRDVKFLKEEIETTIDAKIGFNTLRRLFGFLESNSPSKTTLNRLSNYLGYNSFSNYLNNKTNYNDWYFQQYLLQLRKEKLITQNAIDTINSGISNENNLIYLAYFISFKLEKGEITTLTKLFSSLNFESINGTQLQKFGLIIATSLELLSEKKALKIYESLIGYANFREVVLLLHIDYSNLHDRYSRLLALLHPKNSHTSELFFVSLMAKYRSYYIDMIDPKGISSMPKPIDFDNYFVTLKGRYYGVCLLFEFETFKKIKVELLNACQTNKISYFLIEVIPALIIKEYYDFLNEILEKYYEDVFDGDVWSSETSNAIYLIGLANSNWHKSNLISAHRNLDLVELNKVEIGYVAYVSLFYQLTLMKISHSENDQALNNIAFSELKKLIDKTHFYRFGLLAEKYII
ncbi:MAG: hypothetical protein KA734_01105 [Fluviicola sp.]|nr:hypothetical protein [Fluviicola sp.]MBP6074260.1 hypothetical protein [Flavobacterium sp.]